MGPAAVGFQQDQGFDKMPLILQLSAPGPKTAIMATSLVASAPMAGTMTVAMTTLGPLDTALVDQLFAGAGKIDQSPALAGLTSRAQDVADSADLAGLLGDIWLWDRPWQSHSLFL